LRNETDLSAIKIFSSTGQTIIVSPMGLVATITLIHDVLIVFLAS